MGGSLRKFVPRSPRYELRPHDRPMMRFSLATNHGPAGIEQTHLINLSESGLAILVDPSHSPHIGDEVKVEIPIPGGDQFAWWARVVRVQEYEPNHWVFGEDPFRDQGKLVVGMRFEELPEPINRALRKGLEQSFLAAMREQRYRNWVYYKVLFLQNAAQIALYVALTLFAVGFIYWFSVPDAKYDAKRGTPWGDRYKFW